MLPQLNEKKDDYWEVGKKDLSDPHKFLEELFTYRKDEITDQIIKNIQPYIESESFTPTAIEKVCFCLMMPRNLIALLIHFKHMYSNTCTHSFIHSGHFYRAPSSPLLLRGAPDYSTDTVSEFHAEAHRQLQVKDLPKVPT